MQVNLAERFLILGEVVVQGQEQSFGMFGSHHYARCHFGLGSARSQTQEVEHKFRTGYNCSLPIREQTEQLRVSQDVPLP